MRSTLEMSLSNSSTALLTIGIGLRIVVLRLLATVYGAQVALTTTP